MTNNCIGTVGVGVLLEQRKAKAEMLYPYPSRRTHQLALELLNVCFAH